VDPRSAIAVNPQFEFVQEQRGLGRVSRARLGMQLHSMALSLRFPRHSRYASVRTVSKPCAVPERARGRRNYRGILNAAALSRSRKTRSCLKIQMPSRHLAAVQCHMLALFARASGKWQRSGWASDRGQYRER